MEAEQSMVARLSVLVDVGVRGRLVMQNPPRYQVIGGKPRRWAVRL
jgi:hypothetical protein